MEIYNLASILKFHLIAVKELVRNWAPLVWLAPGERYLPLGVPEFLENVNRDANYLSTRADLGKI